jgi:nucleotide-binding universal stress UspA family protein
MSTPDERQTPVIVVAVTDSPAAFAAARVAIEYCLRVGATLRAVTVLEPAGLVEQRVDVDPLVLADRRELSARAALSQVSRTAARAGIEMEGVVRRGRVSAEILAEARTAHAVLIVMARVSRVDRALASVGSHTLRVLEFADVPVLVTPPSLAPASAPIADHRG